MKVTTAQKRAAQQKGDLYGVRFDGMWEMSPKKAPKYSWTDLITQGSFTTDTIKELPEKIMALRKKFANPNKNKSLKKAVKLSRKFYGFDPRKIKKVNITWPRALVSIGAAAQINYISDKFDGKMREYFHNFENKAVVYVGDTPQKDGTSLIIIHGNFKIKPDGIVG